jgi:hypothetical protein
MRLHDRVGFRVPQIEGAPQNMPALVMERHADGSETKSAQPGRTELVNAHPGRRDFARCRAGRPLSRGSRRRSSTRRLNCGPWGRAPRPNVPTRSCPKPGLAKICTLLNTTRRSDGPVRRRRAPTADRARS